MLYAIARASPRQFLGCPPNSSRHLPVLRRRRSHSDADRYRGELYSAPVTCLSIAACGGAEVVSPDRWPHLVLPIR
jgi:hypothetical protein